MVEANVRDDASLRRATARERGAAETLVTEDWNSTCLRPQKTAAASRGINSRDTRPPPACSGEDIVRRSGATVKPRQLTSALSVRK